MQLGQSFLIFFKKQAKLIIGVYILILFAFLFSVAPHVLNKKSEFIAFLNIGQGDASFIKTNDKNILVDTGYNFNILDRALSRYISPWKRRIDLLILTHDDLDHIGAAEELLKYYKVTHIIIPQTKLEFFERIKKLAEKQGIKVHELYRSYFIKLSASSYIIFYYPFKDAPAADNNSSLVFKFIDGNFSALFLGDAPEEVEQELLRYEPDLYKADVFKLSHHGSKNSNYKYFLQKSNAKLFIASAGKNNKYGHPSEELISFIENNLNSKVFITYKDGDIVVLYDKQTGKYSASAQK